MITDIKNEFSVTIETSYLQGLRVLWHETMYFWMKICVYTICFLHSIEKTSSKKIQNTRIILLVYIVKCMNNSLKQFL